jgi:hypothetical protein
MVKSGEGAADLAMIARSYGEPALQESNQRRHKIAMIAA